jgi:hypothetical protein
MVDPDGRLLYQLTAMKKWSYEQAREAIDAYCEFLTLKIANADYTSTMLSTTDIMDQVWHAHILDTAAYQSFNERFVVDGNTVHHDPLMALDPDARHERCTNTMKAYEDFYRKPFPEDHNAWMNHDLTAFTVEYPMSDNGHSPWARITKGKVMVRKTALVSDVCRQLGLSKFHELQVLIPDTNEQRDVTTVSVSEFLSTKKIVIVHPMDVTNTTSKSLGTISINDYAIGDITYFKVDFATVTFHQIAIVYVEMKGIHIIDARFLIEGQRIDVDAAPAKLSRSYKDGDQVDFLLALGGC